MSMANVFVVDVRPGDGFPTGTTYVPNGPEDVLVSVTSGSWQPTDIAYEILAKVSERAGAHGIIRKLHLASHGNTGCLHMGVGINANNVTGLSILAGHLASSGLHSPAVLVHGCAVASDVKIDDGTIDYSDPRQPRIRQVAMPTAGRAISDPTGWGNLDSDICFRIRNGRGYQFLAAMARTMRTSVQAGIHAQDVDRVGRSGWRLDGAYMTVNLNGRVRLVDQCGNVGISTTPGIYEF